MMKMTTTKMTMVMMIQMKLNRKRDESNKQGIHAMHITTNLQLTHNSQHVSFVLCILFFSTSVVLPSVSQAGFRIVNIFVGRFSWLSCLHFILRHSCSMAIIVISEIITVTQCSIAWFGSCILLYTAHVAHTLSFRLEC